MVVLQRLSSPRPPLDQALQRALTLAAQSVRAGADFDRSGKTALANAAIERGGVEGTCAAKEFAGGLRSKSSGAFCVSISVASFATRKRHLALHCALIHANKEGDYLSLALRLLRQSVVAWRTVDGLTPNFLAISSAVVARPLRVAIRKLMHRSKQLLYSITSSAVTSRVCGTARPSIFAVLRLMISYTLSAAGPAGRRLSAVQDAIHILRGLPFLFQNIDAVRGKTALFGERCQPIDSRQPVARRKLDDQFAIIRQEAVRGDDQAAVRLTA